MKLGDAEGEIVLNDLPGFIGAHFDVEPMPYQGEKMETFAQGPRTLELSLGSVNVGEALARMVGNAIFSAGFAEEAIGQALAEAIKRTTDAMTRILESPDYGQVPSYARRVRPVGRKSNSREWLAWDERQARWRPCYRIAEGGWWWK